MGSSSLPTTLGPQHHDPDARLMLRVRDDDAGAFEELVRRYQSRLLALLANLTRDAHAAEDLAQEVFLRVYRARASYQPTAKFCTWLYTIAHNVARNAKRKGETRKEIAAPLAGAGSTPLTLEELAQAGSGAMPARQFDKAELRAMVRVGLDALGERQRMALLLSKFEGLSYEEIAQTMEISVDAVKSLTWRARETLRAVLEPYLAEGARPQPAPTTTPR